MLGTSTEANAVTWCPDSITDDTTPVTTPGAGGDTDAGDASRRRPAAAVW